ncbi:MAG TPA: DNA-processing protein DprA [Candidatus Peribacteraceae bacterium]|nr:DNA-processing protein DprA [Candidatus Peribacteraceae bacterium]
MTQDTALLFWWLGILTKRRYDVLKQVFGNLDEVIPVLSMDILRELKLRQKTAEETMARIQLLNIDRYKAEMQKHRVGLISIEDRLYPSALREIADPPVFLSYRGDLSILDQPLLGIVGTREISSYGRRVVETFVPSLVRANLITVSGLALGVDAAVAQQTIKAGGKTVAVLGGGLSSIYPHTNRKLAEDIVRHGGLLLSEFPLEMKPDKYTFPSRNRIIAGVSLGTLVCEAPVESGSIITADLALDYNRSVFAVPGSIFDEQYSGCHEIISQGHARLVVRPDDVLRELGMIPSVREESMSFTPANADESMLFTVLSGMPQTIDDLVEKTGLPASYVSVTLTMLELKDVVQNIGGGQWVRR